MPALSTTPTLDLGEASPMKAPPVVGPKTKKATRPNTAIPSFLIEEAKATRTDTWEAQRHMAFEPPATITTMKEIGLEGQGISPNAVSAPFSLFTKEAVLQMRREIFSEPVLNECRYSSDFIANMIRGMGRDRAPFTYQAWSSPEVLDKISQVAGVELVPAYDYEIANINICVNDDPEAAVDPDPCADHVSAVAWHYDSFPFVCVTMVSDCASMVGGETAIQLPDGTVQKVRGPSMGTAVVMQGRYIYHQALRAFGCRERIAMVTPFRPRSPLVRDETILTGVRGISNLDELYPQYAEYRFGVLEERFRERRRDERCRRGAGRCFDIESARAFIREQKEYLESMLEQMYEVE
ncbi:hypothetical protein E5D57_009484 [Metarhizium anisopliae]|nr:hypothetical protein E5D57_009484 [Metarhizium anisopliae]